MAATQCKFLRQGGRSSPLGLRAGDFIFAGALIAVSLLLWVLPRGAGGDRVVVSVDGVRYGEYPSSTPRTIVIETVHGSNTLVIEGGTIHISRADCPDKLCVRQGSVATGCIICLPNRVAVEIVSADGPDAVAS